MGDNRHGMRAEAHAVPVRGTQSFVHTLSWCWQRPSLTALEVLWRWGCGIPLLLLAWHAGMRVLAAAPLDMAALRRMTLLDPVAASATLAEAISVLLPFVLDAARWLVPLAALVWVVGAGLGRTAVLRRADPELTGRPATLMMLHGVRLIALAAVFAAWFGVMRLDGRVTVSDVIAAGGEPNVVLFCAIAIVATLAFFTAWAVLSWALSAAPLLAMRQGFGVVASLRSAFALGAMRGELVEINLVMGIVKIALLVLAMVLSACPLPFESVATPEFMIRWYVGVSVVYLAGSDFFHVVQLVSYLDLWREVGDGTTRRLS
ncbi:MAG: hypothetical protein NVSMB62_27330 [Acidobacteriaceae bacterium]